MSDPNVNRRPQRATEDGEKVTATTTNSVTVTHDELALIGQVSREIGYAQAEAEMAAAWAAAARLIQSVLAMPDRAELARRRGEAS